MSPRGTHPRSREMPVWPDQPHPSRWSRCCGLSQGTMPAGQSLGHFPTLFFPKNSVWLFPAFCLGVLSVLRGGTTASP